MTEKYFVPYVLIEKDLAPFVLLTPNTIYIDEYNATIRLNAMINIQNDLKNTILQTGIKTFELTKGEKYLQQKFLERKLDANH